MRRWSIIITAIMTLTLLTACGPGVPETTTPTLPPEETEPPTEQTISGAYLTPNQVETSMPVYGGVLITGYYIPRTFDAHQKVSYGPTAALPVFNQLVMFDINYKETVPETIIGDLADSWETSPDGAEITFHLHPGVKWHDGVPFTADDVIYSLDKMTDVNRSAISEWFPAYESTEKIDDDTVKVHLKYASAGFMLALAQGESQIQAKHLAGTDDQSAAFMVGTGPFLLTEYLPGVHLKYNRNPDYWKKDKYGNQLPYLDGRVYYNLKWASTQEMVIGRRLDLMDVMSGAASIDTYNNLKNGAPELLWQKRDRYNGSVIFLNTSHKPLDDIRVRRAFGLVLVQEDLIIGYSGDVMFGLPGAGILHPGLGLPKEEIIKLMGWDRAYEERVAEAQQLMAEAGYPDGFKVNLLCTGASASNAGVSLVFAEALRTKLKIDAVVNAGLSTLEIQNRLNEDNYDIYTYSIDVPDPVQLANYFGTGGYYNWPKYYNPELDNMLAELDHILDPEQRRESIWAIERTLLTDLPALPTGCFPPNYMSYYPYVKNLRWNYISYSNINRLEDIWIDKDIYQQVHGKLPPTTVIEPVTIPAPAPTPEPAPVTTPAPATTPAPSPTSGDAYDNQAWPVIWVKIDPPEGVSGAGTAVTVTLKVPPGSMNEIIFINPSTGTRSSRKPNPAVADADGNVVLGPWNIHENAAVGEATIELTNTKTDGSKVVVTHPYTLK